MPEFLETQTKIEVNVNRSERFQTLFKVVIMRKVVVIILTVWLNF